MKTAEDRKNWRCDMHKQILKELPANLQTEEISLQLTEHVQVECWHDTLPFEFAHFSDKELASVLGVEPDAIRFFRELPQPNLNLNGLWKKLRKRLDPLPPSRITSKVVLAEALWPILEAKIRHALDTNSIDDVPVLRVALRAMEIVGHTHRRQVALFEARQVPNVSQPVRSGEDPPQVSGGVAHETAE